MAYQRWWKTIRDQQGNAINGASCAVYTAGTATLATVLDPNSPDQSPSYLANPFVTGPTGIFGFMAQDGEYDVVVSGGSVATQQYRVTLNASTVTYNGAGVVLAGDLAAPTGSAMVGDLAAYAGAVARTQRSKNSDWISVKDFGAVGDGVANDTAAIEAADAAACPGTLGFDGVTVVSRATVYFPPGTYKVDTGSLTYRGAPWVGAGLTNTTLKFYGSSGTALNCVGTLSARKIVSISNMNLDGSACTGTAYGVRLGHNYRSNKVFDNVRIAYFPGPGLYFKENIWMFSAYDLFLTDNAKSWLGTSIFIDATAGQLLNFNWYNLQIENGGYVGSGIAGGFDFPSIPLGENWNFYGGIMEGNKGDAEARFDSVHNLNLYGMYFESDPGSVVDGVIFQGSCNGVANSLYNTAGAGKTGVAFKVLGTSNMTFDQVRGHTNWPSMMQVGNGATVNLLSDGYFFDPITVDAGGKFYRMAPKTVTLTDAATIALDASKGTSFKVVLGGNRTMGAPTNPSVGQRISIRVVQDGVGGRTLAWNAVWHLTWSDTGNTSNKQTSIQFEYDGSTWNQVSSQTPYIS